MSDSKNESSAVSEDLKSKLSRPRIDVDETEAESEPRVPSVLEYDYTNFYFGTGDDAFALLEPFNDWYTQVRPEGYYLYELPLHTQPGTRVDVEDTKTGEIRRNLVNFASYNYLGLSYRPEVKKAIQEAAEIYGGGASGSPILSGTTDLHQKLALEVADFKGQEAALIFPTGYSANVGTIAGSPFPGRYTRYGDVEELLAEADDRYAIFGPGDEIAVTFSADSLSELPEGRERTFFLEASGWCKDTDLYTAHSESVEPLPFRDMPSYPLPEGADPARVGFESDARRVRAAREYHTRRVEPLRLGGLGMTNDE